MRHKIDPQMQIGTIPIADIVFDIYSRHELLPILIALQHLYLNCQQPFEKILNLIRADISKGKSQKLGCKGLSYWELLVLSAVRLGCNMNYDQLADLASNHRTLRQMLGLSDWDKKRFSRSSIQDNIVQLSASTIQTINELIVEIGHAMSPDPLKKVRGDSVVVQKNIHYPTDTNLLFDGTRKIIEITKKIADHFAIPGWRKGGYLKHEIKTTLRKISKVARSRAADRDERLKALYQVIIHQARGIMGKADGTLNILDQKLKSEEASLPEYWKNFVGELHYFIAGTEYMIELAERRIFIEEKIPNPDKVFSLFEPDTELINRGKSPQPIEYGHRVLFIQDSAGFIIHNQVMGQGFTDEKIITEVMRKLQDRYQGKIRAASFDKGFWTPTNLEELSKFISLVVLPKKGGRSEVDRIREGAKDFGKMRKWHSGIESAIHALVAGNGLKVCRDKGASGYDRYIALAVLGRNLQNIGNILLVKERKKRRKHYDPLLDLCLG